MLDDAKYVRNFRVLRYEQFVARPDDMAADLLDRIGLDARPLAPFLAHGWRLQNTNVEPSRLRNANAELIAALSTEDCARVVVDAGELLERLGYFEGRAR
jgi:hypothetical protein